MRRHMPFWHALVISVPRRGVRHLVSNVRLLKGGIRILKKKGSSWLEGEEMQMYIFLTLLSLHYYHLYQSLVTRPNTIGFHAGQSHMTWPIISNLLSYNFFFLSRERNIANYVRTWSLLKVCRQSRDSVHIAFFMVESITVHTYIVTHAFHLTIGAYGCNIIFIPLKRITQTCPSRHGPFHAFHLMVGAMST